MITDQDWNQIILHKPKTEKEKKASRSAHVEVSKESKIDKDSESTAHTTVSKSLSQQITQARLAKNMKQTEVANKINVPVNVIQSYENGKAIPDNNVLQKLRKLFGCKLQK